MVFKGAVENPAHGLSNELSLLFANATHEATLDGFTGEFVDYIGKIKEDKNANPVLLKAIGDIEVFGGFLNSISNKLNLPYGQQKPYFYGTQLTGYSPPTRPEIEKLYRTCLTRAR